MNTHKPHPKCPTCKKALYKAEQKGSKVRKEDPYAWCRNAKCEIRKLISLTPLPKPELPPLPELPPIPTPPSIFPVEKKKTIKRRAMPAPPPKPDEPEGLKKARARIRTLIEDAAPGRRPVEIGIVLAIVNQETGNHEAANLLIDQHDLEKYGIQKV